MLKWISNILSRFSTPSMPSSTLHASPKELSKIYQEEQICPDCREWDFYEGPSGGMSQNIVCGNCGSFFNDSGPFGIERIHWISLELSGDNYREFNSDIIKKWTAVILDNGNLVDTLNRCEDTISNLWSVKRGGNKSQTAITYYFESEEDAVAFKLTWA